MLLKIRNIVALLICAIECATLAGCHDVEQYADDPQGNFEQLWSILDEHYCFFEEKNVDWDAIHSEYGAKVAPQMTREELFAVCGAMLNELRDGHVNLSAPFNTTYYRGWWSQYPQNFSERLIQEYYFNFEYRQTCGILYGMLPGNIGYMHYSSFSSTIGEGNLDSILAYFITADALIIDVRDNGGGAMTNVETLVGRFIKERTFVGTIRHKNGPAHGDFSQPYDVYYNPAEAGRVMWEKPVVVITNRSTFSAANMFVAIMKCLPNVKIVGATTGGGCGMPFSSELPNGWGVRFSASPMTDASGKLTEFGVEPSPGCAVDMDPEEALRGVDTILEFAIQQSRI